MSLTSKTYTYTFGDITEKTTYEYNSSDQMVGATTLIYENGNLISTLKQNMNYSPNGTMMSDNFSTSYANDNGTTTSSNGSYGFSSSSS
jgi:hypothetical protein